MLDGSPAPERPDAPPRVRVVHILVQLDDWLAAAGAAIGPSLLSSIRLERRHFSVSLAVGDGGGGGAISAPSRDQVMTATAQLGLRPSQFVALLLGVHAA